MSDAAATPAASATSSQQQQQQSAASSGDTLAPPAKPNPSRSNSSASSRSNGSRRGQGGQRSHESSASVSRSNSNSTPKQQQQQQQQQQSSAGGGGDRKKGGNGNTTTISGGTSLGGKGSGAGGASTPSADNKRTRAHKNDAKSISRRSSTKAPQRPSSAASSNTNKDSKASAAATAAAVTAAVAKTAPAPSAPVDIPSKDRDSSSGSGQPHSLSIHTSSPVTAMEAAVNAATKKHIDVHGEDALSSLQRMISDLKTLSPTSSQAGSRNVSNSSKEKGSEPMTIPSPTASSTRLKADAPTFTPGSLRSNSSSNSPTISTSLQQQQSASARSNNSANRRSSNTSISLPGGAGSFSAAMGSFPAGLGFQNPLSAHSEASEIEGAFAAQQQQFAGQPVDLFQQQQLLAAQHLQLQILQQQILQNQLATQQQREQGFIAPRFQALAAQRAALQQQQQQSAQLAEAQRLFELHQQQQLLAAQEELARAGGGPVSPVNVFEEDSPEPTPQPVRGQLNQGFTFGKRRESSDDKGRSAQRSEAMATLGGLAARAHKRSGSELTPAMEEQLEIQKQIEALQAKQKELMNREREPASSPSDHLKPSQTLNRHRRTQSNMSSGSTQGAAAGEYTVMLNTPDLDKSARSFGDVPMPLSAGLPPHARRHSMNVFNKGAGAGSGFGEYVIDEGGSISIPAGGFGGGGHHRTGSRADSNWRLGGGGGGAGGNTADLASATAQLASLAQFRAAAGSGHAKMASFSFPNMLPNLLAATTLQAPSGQSSLWQQQQAFQMQLQQNSQGPQRKSLFAPYLPQASLPPLLSAGKLVVGILRVNKKNRSDAYVATDVLDADIYICGSKDRNRALEGDIVAVELLDVDEVWSTKKDKEEKKRKKEESYDVKPSAAKKMEKKKDDIEVEGQGLTLFEDEEVNDDTKPTYAGHVVAVVERMPGQLFSGQLGVLRPSSAATKEKQEAERREREGDRKPEKSEPEPRPKIVWFKPTDKRVPLIAIPTEQAPVDFIENPEAHTNKLFVATIKRWPITSLHPFGTLVEELGPIGSCEVETSAILKDCNFPTEEFSDVALKCLPPLPWTIPEREYEVRTDLREDCVFTIDPEGARDLDDALSVKPNEDGTYTVGVHIADVSYFVKPNTALDRDARKRATSVYLVQRSVPMLPPLLAEQLCSLVPDVERLTFSAFFVIDKEGNVLEKSYKRSIIKSTAQLSYVDVSAVMEGKSLPASSVSNAHPASKVESDVRTLSEIAKKLRAKRVENGSMFSNRIKLGFTLDDEGRPVDVSQLAKTDANIVVEEFMVLTNLSVAAVIANGLPEQALLRRHEAPLERRMDAFVKRAKRLGYDLDSTNAGTLQKGFDKITDKEIVYCLNILEKKTMPAARYFCTGMLDIAKYSHWALNAPLYTHFTSPIRRYADVLVHRMLDACLTSPSPSDVKFHMDRDQLAKCAQHCNMKRSSARLAEDQSVHLYLSLLVSDLSQRYGPVIRHARVTAVYDQAFDVVIPEFGLEKRVHIDKLPLENYVFDEHKNVLSLYWTNQDVLTFLTNQGTEDEHLFKIKQRVEGQATGAVTSQVADADALFTDSDGTKSSQHQKSADKGPHVFEGLRTNAAGHQIQDIKELASLPVLITADMSKSPPVLVVYACNPYSTSPA